MGGNASVPIQGQRWTQSAVRAVPGRSPLGSVQYNASPQSQTPLVQVDGAATTDRAVKTEADRIAEANATITSPASTATLGRSPIEPTASPKQE